MRLILTVLLITPLLLLLNFNYSLPAVAIIRQQEESSGQVLYQSRHTLSDNNNHSWQVILFKRNQDGKVKEINLRLVGFPDSAAFSHPQPLVITTRDGKVFEAGDCFAQKTPASNVGEYDFKDILPEVSINQSLQLALPLVGSTQVFLLVPSSVIVEWKDMSAS